MSKHSIQKEYHEVQATVQIEVGILTSQTDSLFRDSVRNKKRKRIYQAPKPEYFFHFEYQLLDSDTDRYETDIVTFGQVVKCYTEIDSKLLRTWKDAGVTYFAWNHSHTFSLNKEQLLSLYQHSLQIEVWDTKESCSVKAQTDQPKAFRLPTNTDKSITNQDLETPLEEIVRKYSRTYVAHTKESLSGVGKKKSDNEKLKNDLNDSYFVKEESEIVSVMQPATISIEGNTSTLDQTSTLSPMQARKTDSKPSNTQKKWPSESHSYGHSSRSIKLDSKQQALGDHTAPSLTKISLTWSQLFSNLKTCYASLNKPVGNIAKCKVTLQLDTPLMPPYLYSEFNPLTITIMHASNMPNTPHSYEQLHEVCEPAYFKYSFMKPEVQPKDEGIASHFNITSIPIAQHQKLVWNHSTVFLAGIYGYDRIFEILQGPIFTVEIHDRDRVPPNKNLNPALYGDLLSDKDIANPGIISSMQTTQNPFYSKPSVWSPYGIAKFNISDLTNGHTILNLTSPIMHGPSNSLVNSEREKEMMELFNCENFKIKLGDYLNCGSELSIRVEIAYPLMRNSAQLSLLPSPNKAHCPFTRLIYITDIQNEHNLDILFAKIRTLNAESLNLHNIPSHLIDSALSTYKLNLNQQIDQNLNIITGFHIEDTHFAIIYLEGLRNYGLDVVYDALLEIKIDNPNSIHKILYDANLVFSSRLYATLDVDLFLINLALPLQDLTTNPALYSSDVKSHTQTLNNLSIICHINSLQEVIRSSLLPSAEDLLKLNKDLGVPSSFRELVSTATSESGPICSSKFTSLIGMRTPIQNTNIEYEDLLKTRSFQTKNNYIKDNKLRLSLQSTTAKSRRFLPSTFRDDPILASRLESLDLSGLNFTNRFSPTPDAPVFNYSTQTYNSTILSKKQLQKSLKAFPNVRFTHSQNYNSMTLDSYDIYDVKLMDETKRIAKFRTPNGFIYPEKRSAYGDNIPKIPLHHSRIEELKEKFVDNIYHKNLEPILNCETYQWPNSEMSQFDTFKKQPLDFGITYPVTIFKAGDSKLREERESESQEKKIWQNKLVVSNPEMSFYTETSVNLSKAQFQARQLNKLKGILKDFPVKPALTETSYHHPALSVIYGLSESEKISSSGYLPCTEITAGWKLDRNVIPRHS